MNITHLSDSLITTLIRQIIIVNIIMVTDTVTIEHSAFSFTHGSNTSASAILGEPGSPKRDVRKEGRKCLG